MRTFFKQKFYLAQRNAALLQQQQCSRTGFVIKFSQQQQHLIIFLVYLNLMCCSVDEDNCRLMKLNIFPRFLDFNPNFILSITFLISDKKNSSQLADNEFYQRFDKRFSESFVRFTFPSFSANFKNVENLNLVGPKRFVGVICSNKNVEMSRRGETPGTLLVKRIV